MAVEPIWYLARGIYSSKTQARTQKAERPPQPINKTWKEYSFQGDAIWVHKPLNPVYLKGSAIWVYITPPPNIFQGGAIWVHKTPPPNISQGIHLGSPHPLTPTNVDIIVCKWLTIMLIHRWAKLEGISFLRTPLTSWKFVKLWTEITQAAAKTNLGNGVRELKISPSYGSSAKAEKQNWRLPIQSSNKILVGTENVSCTLHIEHRALKLLWSVARVLTKSFATKFPSIHFAVDELQEIWMIIQRESQSKILSQFWNNVHICT